MENDMIYAITAVLLYLAIAALVYLDTLRNWELPGHEVPG